MQDCTFAAETERNALLTGEAQSNDGHLCSFPPTQLCDELDIASQKAEEGPCAMNELCFSILSFILKSTPSPSGLFPIALFFQCCYTGGEVCNGTLQEAFEDRVPEHAAQETGSYSAGTFISREEQCRCSVVVLRSVDGAGLGTLV